MSNLLSKIFIHLRIKKISEQDIQLWSRSMEEGMIILATEKASHAIRMKAIENLGKMDKTFRMKNQLIKLMGDPVISIAIQASNTIQKSYTTDSLERDVFFNKAYRQLCDRIEKEEQLTNYFSSFKQSTDPVRKGKHDMKRLDAVKKSLRRPIR